MAKIDFYKIDNDEKAAVFTEIATQKGMKPFAVEKDWWVCRTLELIFNMPIAQHLVFKGGTSLSKAWKLINRFSEDIDLAINKEFFIISEKEWTKKEITKLRQLSGIYCSNTFVEDLKKEFEIKGYNGLVLNVIDTKESDQDPRIIDIFYPNVIKSDTEYLLPRVQIEISCRSLIEPFSLQSFGSLVDEYYSGEDFAEPLFQIPTVNPERTFLEKLFLLHEEFHRPAEKNRVNRLSRHIYDIYQLTQSGIASKAMSDKGLYESIVVHRHKFSRVSGVDYNLLNPITLNPIPPQNLISKWENDYLKMKEDMIFDDQKPSFEDLINNLKQLRVLMNELEWSFELEFKV